MSKSYSVAFVAVVICLLIILLSSESGAQPTVDETASCSASTLQEVTSVVTRQLKEIKAFQSSNQELNAREFKEVRKLLASNLSNTEKEVTNNVSRQLKDVKNLLASNLSKTVKEVTNNVSKQLKEVKNLLAPNLSKTMEKITNNVTRELKAFQSSNQEQNAKEFEEVKNLLASNLSNTVEEIINNVSRQLKEMKDLLPSMQERPCFNSREALVLGLTSKYPVSFTYVASMP